MAVKQVFTGTIVACTHVQQYTKHNGEVSVKCVYHLRDDEGRELAVSATGELTNYVGMVGVRARVTYVCRVFGFDRAGKDWIGNDVYATDIKID